jgi:hypothetical protein
LKFRRPLSSLFLFVCALAHADSGLLYLEAQGVGGYSSQKERLVPYSMDSREVMQKPSLGADWIQKFSGPVGDWGSLALQGRLAWDDAGGPSIEPQLFNAYFRLRTPYGYAWAGHSRVAAGLESYFDTHGALLQPLPMYGFGFDRDWGGGLSRDFSWGDAALSVTTGSGMPIYLKGGYLVSARVSKGVLNRDNYNFGAYYSGGRTPDVIGYHILNGEAKAYDFGGADAAVLWDRFELRLDGRAGKKDDAAAYAVLARIGVNILEENRLKVEFQPVFTRADGRNDHSLGTGVSYTATPELTWRSLYEYDQNERDHRVIVQAYYYVKL